METLRVVVDVPALVTGVAVVWLAVALGVLVRRRGAWRSERTLAYAAAYAGAVAVGRSLMIPETGLALFWPAAGVAALWVLGSRSVLERRLDTLALFTTTVLANELLGVATAPALAFGVANVTVAWAVRATCRRGAEGGEPELSTTRDLRTLGIGALLAGMASAPAGWTASRLVTGAWHTDVLSGWVLRNACGVLLVVVIAMALESCRRGRVAGDGVRGVLASRRRPWVGRELAGVAVVSALTWAGVFGSRGGLPLAFVALVLSAYVGSRFSPLVGSVHTALMAVVSIVATLQDRGPFGGIADPLLRAEVVQAFLVSASLVTLTYALAARDRERLVRRLEETEREATSQARLLEAVTAGMSEGLVVLEESGRVLIDNPAARAFLPPGIDAVRQVDELASLSLFGPDGRPLSPEESPHGRALATGEVVETDLLRREESTGRESVLGVVADPVTLDGGRRLAVVRLRDVTEERAQLRGLEAFAGVVAHDLRAPLAAITSWAEILQDELAAARVRDDTRASGRPGAAGSLHAGPPADGGATASLDPAFVDSSLTRIRTAGAQMNVLIEDLLTYATVGSATLAPVEVDLEEVVDDVVGVLLAQAAASGRIPPLVQADALLPVVADLPLVRQLLLNVIGNAVKYVAPDVTPYVRLSTRALADGMVELTVADNGIGIPAEARARVFDDFYRAHRELAYPGTGLGLAICAQAVQRHGGRIAAHPGPGGRGTSMVLTLPGRT